MSVRVMGMVFDGGPDDIGQHSVMLALADNADEDGLAWPGIELLARKSRHSERHVTRVLAALEAGGWLTIRRRVRGIRRRCSEYRLNLARLKSMAEMRAREASEPEIPRTDIVSGGKPKREANTDTLRPRTDTVSGGDDERPNDADELTLEPPRTDMTLTDLVLNQGDAFHNRHRTTIEPKDSPLPPAAQGEALGEAVRRVMRECNFVADRRLERVIRAALELHCDKTGKDPDEAATLAIGNQRTFVEERQYMQHSLNWVTFFRRGYWVDWQAWPVDQARVDRARDARVGVHQ